MQFRKFLTHIVDFIFPPNEFEIELRKIDIESVFTRLPNASKTEFPFIFSIFSYQHPLVKELVWQIKYKKNSHALELAGYSIYTRIKEVCGDSTKILLIPVPISNSRRRERGYNQCELIVNAILKYDTGNIFETDFGLLLRNRHIEKQTFMNKDQRIENTKDIFDVTHSNKIDIIVIIIDDVSTTGSTLYVAREALLDAGYKNVIAYTLAH
jgi:ComF family protein